MREFDENKLAKLHTAEELLHNKYGETRLPVTFYLYYQKQNSHP